MLPIGKCIFLYLATLAAILVNNNILFPLLSQKA